MKAFFDTHSAPNGKMVLFYTGAMFPIHNGHFETVMRAKSQLEAAGFVVCVVVCPTGPSYVKSKLGANLSMHQCLFANDNALELVARTFAGVDGIFLSKYDYSAFRDYPQTVSAARSTIKAFPGMELVTVNYLIGQDNAIGMGKLGQLSKDGVEFADGLVVARRVSSKDSDPIYNSLTTDEIYKWIIWIDMPENTLEISSTKIRVKLASGESVSDIVPASIATLLHKLYNIKA